MGAADCRVVRFGEGGWEQRTDRVVEEVPLTLEVNGREIVTLLSLGEHPVELAVGFLRAEGFLGARDELLGWDEAPGRLRVRAAREPRAVAELLERRTLTTGCGKGVTFYNVLDGLRCKPLTGGAVWSPGSLQRRMRDLQQRSGLYRETGGTHNASLVRDDRTLCFRTDIGRHNAVDMLGGWAYLQEVALGDTALLTTGRISSEIVVKSTKMGVPVLVSRSAPTALALRLAEEVGVTVVGYVRAGRLTVYTHPRRVAGAAEADGAGHG